MALHHGNERPWAAGDLVSHRGSHTSTWDVFQDAFVYECKSLETLNQHGSNVLRPCNTLILNTYSDAKRKNSENFFETGELLQRPQVRQYKGRHTTASHNRPNEGKSSDAKWSFTSYTLQGGFIWHLSQWCVDENLPQPQLLNIKNNPKGLLGLNAVQVALCLVWVTECGGKKSFKVNESFKSLKKHKQSISFGSLLAADEGVDDLEES